MELLEKRRNLRNFTRNSGVRGWHGHRRDHRATLSRRDIVGQRKLQIDDA